MNKVTVIIPYKVDRGWLNEAVDSVEKQTYGMDNIQLILSQGEGNWPQNFNKVLSKATGDYIKFLHEDDMLMTNCVEDSVYAFSVLDVDFIHGMAREIFMNAGRRLGLYIPPVKVPTFSDLLKKNVIHSTTLIYKREIFEKIGGFNESPKMYSFEEYEFNLRVLKAGFRIGYINAPLAYYRRHPNQIIRTCNTQERKQNRQEMLNMHL